MPGQTAAQRLDHHTQFDNDYDDDDDDHNDNDDDTENVDDIDDDDGDDDDSGEQLHYQSHMSVQKRNC